MGTYWQFVAANIAIMMTAATALRTFFISGVGSRESPSPESKEARKFVRQTLIPHSWLSKRSAGNPGDGSNWNRPFKHPLQAPRAMMTGIRTFIHGQGRTRTGDSQMVHSMIEERHEDSWPLSPKGRSAPSIIIEQDIAEFMMVLEKSTRTGQQTVKSSAPPFYSCQSGSLSSVK